MRKAAKNKETDLENSDHFYRSQIVEKSEDQILRFAFACFYLLILSVAD